METRISGGANLPLAPAALRSLYHVLVPNSALLEQALRWMPESLFYAILTS